LNNVDIKYYAQKLSRCSPQEIEHLRDSLCGIVYQYSPHTYKPLDEFLSRKLPLFANERHLLSHFLPRSNSFDSFEPILLDCVRIFSRLLPRIKRWTQKNNASIYEQIHQIHHVRALKEYRWKQGGRNYNYLVSNNELLLTFLYDKAKIPFEKHSGSTFTQKKFTQPTKQITTNLGKNRFRLYQNFRRVRISNFDSVRIPSN
jgi:hypothetical protein